MSPERRYLWVAVAVVVVATLVLVLTPRVREELAPEPRHALVAVSVGSSPVARVGRVELASGERFELHAVLVAETGDGETVYYTEAEGLEIDGETVPAGRLRRWDRPGRVVVLWFTVEGYRPFVEIESLEQLDDYRFEVAFRPDWGRGWTIAGSVTPRNHSLARGPLPEAELPFGTARYHVRIERYSRSGEPMPVARYSSPAGEAVIGGSSSPTRVVMRLPGALGRPSAVFGLPQLEPGGAAPRPLMRRLAEWYRGEIAFSRLLVLSGMLADRGLAWPDLDWAPLDLAEAPAFAAAGAGDLLRSGERIVVIYRDRGEEGRLDYEDLCIDFAESAAVRPLGEVFTGGGVVDWADLDGAAPQDANRPGVDLSGPDLASATEDGKGD